MKALAIPSSMLCVLLAAGCGTVVPDIQQFPGTAQENQRLVVEIVESVRCELREAIVRIINDDKEYAQSRPGNVRFTEWLHSWGVKVGLTLTIEEKTTVSPRFVWTPDPITALFSLGGGGSLSGTATRVNKLQYIYSIDQLYELGTCSEQVYADNRGGSRLIESRLKVDEWLGTQVQIVAQGLTNAPIDKSSPLKDNVMSHQVKFVVALSGNVNPAWVLTEFTVNSGGSLFATNRDTTHDLLLTFGPIDKDTGEIAESAAQSFFASQINLNDDQ